MDGVALMERSGKRLIVRDPTINVVAMVELVGERRVHVGEGQIVLRGDLVGAMLFAATRERSTQFLLRRLKHDHLWTHMERHPRLARASGLLVANVPESAWLPRKRERNRVPLWQVRRSGRRYFASRHEPTRSMTSRY